MKKPDGKRTNAELCRDWYLRNRDRKYAMQVRRKQDIARLIDETKRASGCKQCRERDPACLVFHHRDRATKKFAVAYAAFGRFGIDVVLEEIAKCDVLCANCHLIHHWEERQMKKKGSAL